MKRFISMAFILLSMAVLAAQGKNRLTFSSTDLSGAAVTDSLFSNNKITMVNVWGTFCPPCIREMPDLGKLNEEFKDKEFQIIGIPVDAVDRNGNVIPKIKNDALKIIEKTGAYYTHVLPSKEMTSGFLRNVQAVPTTYFVDSQGNFVGLPYLGAKSYQDWKNIIETFLSSY